MSKSDLQTWVRLEMGMIGFLIQSCYPEPSKVMVLCSTFASFTVQMGDVLRYFVTGSAMILETLRPGCIEVSQSTLSDTTQTLAHSSHMHAKAPRCIFLPVSLFLPG